MGIGCDHLSSGRGRCHCVLLRYLVLLNQLSVCASCIRCQLHVGCAWPTPKLYADHGQISSTTTADFLDKSSDIAACGRLVPLCG